MNEPKKTDYRDTVFLPKTDFPMRGNLPQQEPKLLERWQAMGLYQRLRQQGRGREKFILHDGPAYSNGNIHIGHALNRVLKDVVNRTQFMTGRDIAYVPGFDCHGLPIEWKVEEGYRAKGQNKDDIPVAQIVAECRAFAGKWVEVQRREFQRLGIMADWDHVYTTMQPKSEAQIVREIHKFLLNGLLYKGVKPVMWSVVEKTALAEAEIEYQNHTSTTLWVKFPVIKTSNEALKGASVVIWTTTPWTIPANRAIAYGDFAYALIAVEEIGEGALAKIGDKLVVAESLLDQFCQDAKITRVQKIAALKNDDLTGVVCSHPFRGRAGSEGYFNYDVPLYHGDFVTTEAGTGFVHIAPGHGEDDFNLGQKYKIKFEETVGDDGRYLPNVKGFAGLYVYKPDGKVGEANGAVIKALIEANALLAKKNIKHSYPHSWRSKAPLIFRTTPQWFIALDQIAKDQTKTLRELALDGIEATAWYPSIGKNRIRGMIEGRPDWCISRQRAWGVPIALFIDKKTGEPLKDEAVLERIAASFARDGLEAWHQTSAQDYLGESYRIEDYEQVFDIVDVWFDSASTHAFVLDLRCNGGEWPELQWPADLYLEGSDQHRGWFHSSLLESCGTRGRPPYKAVLTHGFTLDEQGRKMSKSLGNVTAPQQVIDQMGADILRLWVVSSDYTEDLRVGTEILKQTGDLYRRFRNTLRYLLGALDGMSAAERLPVAEMPELEQWVLHRLHEMDALVRADIAKFDFTHMISALHDFCNSDLSAFYFDVRKDSLYCDRPDSTRRRAARTVMEYLFNHLVAWLAPVLAFTAEEAWTIRNGASDDSVHLQTFVEVPKAWQNDALAKKWAEIRAIRSRVTNVMEQARNDKLIGSSLQAHPTVPVTAEEKVLFDTVDFAEICISSGMTLIVAVEIFAPTVAVAQGQKCERCWQVLPEVGEHADHPDLCHRCHDAVTHLRKEAA